MTKRKEININVGKRKNAVARAVFRTGTGIVRINGTLLNTIEPDMVRLMITEPLILSGDFFKKFNISVDVRGGGVMGQASAVRQAIAKGLAEREASLKQKFIDYDRSLIVADVRRNEPHKPSRSSAGPRRHKQRSKR